MAKILIADDSAFMRNILSDIVKGAGHEVTEAQNGKEVLQGSENDKPDVIFLDIIMPEMGGVDVLKKIGGSNKIVVISAVGQDKMVQEAKTLGAIDYIVKPFERDDVIKALERALE